MPSAAEMELQRLTQRYAGSSETGAGGDISRVPTVQDTPAARELLRLGQRFGFESTQPPNPIGQGFVSPQANIPRPGMFTGATEAEKSTLPSPGPIKRTAVEIQKQLNDLKQAYNENLAKTIPDKESVPSLVNRAIVGVATGIPSFLLGQVPEMISDMGLDDPGQFGEDVAELVTSGKTSERTVKLTEFVSGIRELAGSALVTGDNLVRKYLEFTPDPLDDDAYQFFVDKVGGRVTELILGRKLTKPEYDKVIEHAIENPEEPVFGAMILSGALKSGAKLRGAEQLPIDISRLGIERKKPAKLEPTTEEPLKETIESKPSEIVRRETIEVEPVERGRVKLPEDVSVEQPKPEIPKVEKETVPTKAVKKPVEVQPTPEPKPVAETPAEAVKEIVEGKRESKLPMKDFKKQMIERLSEQMKSAKEETQSFQDRRATYQVFLESEKRSRSTVKEFNRKILEHEKELAQAAKESGIEKVTVTIPGDGEFTFYNTKPIIKEIQKKVRALPISAPKEAPIGLKPAPVRDAPAPEFKLEVEDTGGLGSGGLSVKPIPATRRASKLTKIAETEPVDFYTNGHWLLKKEYFKQEPVQDPIQPNRSFKKKDLNETISSIKKSHKKSVEFEEVGRLDRGGYGERLPDLAVFSDGSSFVFFNAEYVDAIKKLAPDVKMLRDPTSTAETGGLLYDGKKFAGILMPVDPPKSLGRLALSKSGKTLIQSEAAREAKVSTPTLEEAKATGEVIFEPKEKTKGGKRTVAGDAYLGGVDPGSVPLSDYVVESKIQKDFPTRKLEGGIKPGDITEKMKKDFNVTVRTGRVPAQFSGFYTHGYDIVRVKDLKDIGVMTHEVAHAIDYKMGLGKELFQPLFNERGNLLHHKKQPPWVKELRDMDYKQKKGGRRLHEGFAEFMRAFLTESADISVIAPEFSKRFFGWLDKNADVKTKLHDTREMIRQWRSQGAASRVYAQIDVKGRGFRLPIGEKVKQFGRKLEVRFLDDVYMLEYAEKQIRGVTDLNPRKIDPATSPTMIARAVAKTAWSKAHEMVIGGTFDFAGNPTGLSLRAALEPVSKNLKDWLTYSYAKRAVELHKRGINPGIDLSDAQYVVRQVEAAEHGARFTAALEQVVRWNDRVLQYAVEAGALSKEAAQKMRSMNEWYVPLKRVMETDPSWASAGPSRLSDLPSVTKRIKGSGRQIQHPLDAMIENAAKIISISDKTRIGKALVDLVRSQARKNAPRTVQGVRKTGALETQNVGRWVYPVKQPQQLVRAQAARIIEELKKQGFIGEAEISDAVLDGGTVSFFVNQHMYLGKDNIVSFMHKGKREFWEMDKELYQAIKGVDNYFLPPVFDWIFGKPSRALRLGATGLNPGFTLITNPVRDALTYTLQTEYVKQNNVVGSYMRAMLEQTPFGSESMKNMRQLFRRSGADMSTFLGGDRRSIRRLRDEAVHHRGFNIVAHPIDLARDILSVSEVIPRMAEYEAAYKKGKDLYGKGSAGAQIMAANAASEVTVNFRRMGVYGRVLNQAIPFWNATVQGPLRFGRYAKAHPVGAMFKAMSYVTAPTLVLWWLHKDEDWYKQLPDWQKYNYWHFEVGKEADGSPRIMRLPRPFEWGILFGSLPEATLNYWNDKNPDLLKESLQHLVEQNLPGMMPVLPRLWYEVHSNYNLFTDRPIDPTWEVEYTRHTPEARFSPWTSETAKFIGKQFGQSPRHIDHVIRGLTGGLGTSVIGGIERATGLKSDAGHLRTAPDLPVVGRLFTRTRSAEEIKSQLEFERRNMKAELSRLLKLANDTGDDYFREKARKELERWNRFHPDDKIFKFIPKKRGN